MEGKNMIQDKYAITYKRRKICETMEVACRGVKRTGAPINRYAITYKRRKICDSEESSKSSETQRVVLSKERLAHMPQLSNVNIVDRREVEKTLRLFYEACEMKLKEHNAKPRVIGEKFRVDYEASRFLKRKGLHLNGCKKIVGHVPGVQVGDEFQYRMELNILGIHVPSQGGIYYMKEKRSKNLIAMSIVSSGGYNDDTKNPNVFVYTGQGNTNLNPKDQEHVRGNLALRNSLDKKNPVRVTIGHKKTGPTFSVDAKNYVYHGLFMVTDFWEVIGSKGNLVYKFELRRLDELTGEPVVKSKRYKVRDSVRKVDISEGKETLPIRAVNYLDDEEPPSFIYIAKMRYPDLCQPIIPKSCNCIKHCADCPCIAKNGGELPYNKYGAIILSKPMIYECGTHCRCPLSCDLRVTQRGIKIQLEIFRTKSKGWGVRSPNSIRSGSFVCEYVGEILEELEAEKLVGIDEYLYDIGKENGISEFTIDGARRGNVGRFINHSCSPNLFVQDVLYDHGDTRMPHIMLFAMEDIPPFQELTYHYNYEIDQVRDSNGVIKKKSCCCGSSECTGRLY